MKILLIKKSQLDNMADINIATFDSHWDPKKKANVPGSQTRFSSAETDFTEYSVLREADGMLEVYFQDDNAAKKFAAALKKAN